MIAPVPTAPITALRRRQRDQGRQGFGRATRRKRIWAEAAARAEVEAKVLVVERIRASYAAEKDLGRGGGKGYAAEKDLGRGGGKGYAAEKDLGEQTGLAGIRTGKG